MTDRELADAHEGHGRGAGSGDTVPSAGDLSPPGESRASVRAAAILAEALPAMIAEAEDGGLMIIAAQLTRTLDLASRVAAAAQEPSRST